MRHSPDAPVAVLSPHLDDAVLSTWSVLRRPGAVHVVNVCAGIPPSGPATPWDSLTGARDRAERVRERLEEDRRALVHAGREATHLDFLDNQYRDSPLEASALGEAISAAVPTASELWAPAGVGGHPDHVQVRAAALALAAAGEVPLRLYCELPYSVKRGWPAWVTGRAHRDALDRDAWLRAFLPPGTEYPGDAYELTRGAAREKLRALREYRTQWVALATEGQMGSRRALRYEASFAAGAVASIASSSATKRSSEKRSA